MSNSPEEQHVTNTLDKSTYKISNSNVNYSMKGKLISLDNMITYVYQEIDKSKKDLNGLKIENEKMNEQLGKKFIKIETKLKDLVDDMKLNAEDKFSKQRTSNKDYFNNIKLLKAEHISLNKKLTTLQKRLSFLENHVGCEDMK
jgi:maltodextrin utilization protein YvdJ